jgi:transcriptional regulator with XRE-family HTH domain
LAVADLLRKRRIELGLNIRQASEKAGLDNNHYWNLEHGKSDMYLSTLAKVLDALDLEFHLKKRKTT